MKINIEIDLTPDEARAFFGLPNYSQMHETWLKNVKGKIEENAANADIEPMMKAWSSVGSSMGGMANEALNTFFAALNTAATDIDTSKSKPKKSGEK